MQEQKLNIDVERYLVHWIDSMGHGYKQFDSIEEVRGWSKYTAKVLGKAELYMPTYEVKLSSGRALTDEQLALIQPESSEATYDKRELEAQKWLARGNFSPSRPRATMRTGADMAYVLRSGAFANLDQSTAEITGLSDLFTAIEQKQK